MKKWFFTTPDIEGLVESTDRARFLPVETGLFSWPWWSPRITLDVDFTFTFPRIPFSINQQICSLNRLTKLKGKRAYLTFHFKYLRIQPNNFWCSSFLFLFFQVDAWNYWNVVYVSRIKEWTVSTPGNLGGVAIWSPATPWTLGSTTGKLGVVDLLLWLFSCTAAFLILCGPPATGPSLTSLDDSFEVKGLWDTSPEVFELTPRLGKNWHHDGMKLFLYRNYI